MFDSPLVILAMFFWLSYVPIAAIQLFRLITNRKVFVDKDPGKATVAAATTTAVVAHNHSTTNNSNSNNNNNVDATVIFQITTRSATRTPVVRRGIESVIESAHVTGFHNYQVSVVTDDPEDERTLGDIRCEVVIVDKGYQTDAIRKGRALQYAVEHRRRQGKNTKKYWIFHMDDESYVTPQTVLAALKFIKKGRGVASEGPIFYPLKFESASRLTAIAESIRPFACYDCVSQMTHPPPLHMHGSNLLVRSDVEDAIGWKFGPTLAEDQMFGFKVYEKYGPGSMGWHGGMLLEQPPLNIRDHFFQRRRWVLGTMQNMDKFPALHRFKLMYKSVTYFLGFASAVASTFIMLSNYIPAALSPASSLAAFEAEVRSFSIANELATTTPLEIGTGAVLLFTSIVWLASYQLGLYLNLKYSGIGWRKKVSLHFQTLLLSPVVGLVETFPAFWAMIEYQLKKKKEPQKVQTYDFYVVNK
ncbi:glycosyltransferase family 2 protein [Nitrososphaera sp.]|uniref:glycosyltransferase family 2 protein n=1 Tax=Nitrososphaera sp. TaxID=1971748 RepID=UPI00307D57FC